MEFIQEIKVERQYVEHNIENGPKFTAVVLSFLI